MAAPFKFSPAFLVNHTLPGDQTQPAITALADGRFAVVWRDVASKNSAGVIRAQTFDPDGTPLGSEFTVLTSVLGSRSAPALAGQLDGGFAVAWVESTPTLSDPSGASIRVRINGVERQVNTTVTGSQTSPTMATLADGRVVVAWVDGAGGADPNIRAQIFNADGSRSGIEFSVNQTLGGAQEQPMVTALADGRFVATWADNSGSVFSTHAQIFNADGSASGSEINVGSNPLGSLYEHPSIAAMADGRIAIAFAFADPLGAASEIVLNIYNSDGTASSRFSKPSANISGFQEDPAICALTDGRIAVAWTLAIGTDRVIYTQLFNTDGTEASEPLVVRPGFSVLNAPTITVLADGRYAVSWTDAPTGGTADVWCQIYDPREAAISLNGTLLDDTFIGTHLADRLGGFIGDDTLAGASGDDLVSGGVGNDDLRGGASNDQVSGDDGDDALVGGSGSDGLDGGAGNDTLNGGFGIDATSGGLGDDVHVVDLTGDLVVESAAGGVDRVQSATISLFLANYLNVENATVTGSLALSLTGSAGDNTLTGNNAANQLLGQGGDDVLIGNGGADRLDGETGNDTLSGGAGGDVFVFAAGSGADEVTDYADRRDQIDLSAYGFASVAVAKSFMTDLTGDLVFTNGTDVLTIDGMTKAQITAADLIL